MLFINFPNLYVYILNINKKRNRGDNINFKTTSIQKHKNHKIITLKNLSHPLGVIFYWWCFFAFSSMQALLFGYILKIRKRNWLMKCKTREWHLFNCWPKCRLLSRVQPEWQVFSVSYTLVTLCLYTLFSVLVCSF